MAALDDVSSDGVVVRLREGLVACFRDPVSRSGRNHSRIDVIKLLAIQDVGRADVRTLYAGVTASDVLQHVHFT